MLSDEVVLAAMSCFLSLENRTEYASVGGPTWAGVSQFFVARVPVNLAALYYISYLYTGNWKHGNAIALRGEGADSYEGSLRLYVTRPDAVRKAYGSYRRWFEKVKQLGLAGAREQKLDPLEGTGLWWY
jgi:hypothetical protein